MFSAPYLHPLTSSRAKLYPSKSDSLEPMNSFSPSTNHCPHRWKLSSGCEFEGPVLKFHSCFGWYLPCVSLKLQMLGCPKRKSQMQQEIHRRKILPIITSCKLYYPLYKVLNTYNIFNWYILIIYVCTQSLEQTHTLQTFKIDYGKKALNRWDGWVIGCVGVKSKLAVWRRPRTHTRRMDQRLYPFPKAARKVPQLGRITHGQWTAHKSRTLGSWHAKTRCQQNHSSAAIGMSPSEPACLPTAWYSLCLVDTGFGFPCLFPFSLLHMRKVVREERQMGNISPSTSTQSWKPEFRAMEVEDVSCPSVSSPPHIGTTHDSYLINTCWVRKWIRRQYSLVSGV